MNSLLFRRNIFRRMKIYYRYSMIGIILFFIGLLWPNWKKLLAKDGWLDLAQGGNMKCTNNLHEASVDISTLHLYKTLPMPKRGGGDKDWAKLYMDYNLSRWRDDPLHIFLIPFSHTDPGWLKTAADYFFEKSRHVITNAVLKLHQHKKMTFIWAESIYLSWWWDMANSTMRDLLKALLKEGRFEITGGGWVMSDEANPTGYALLDQLLEGHLFLRQKLEYTPKTSFNIDPFGHSAIAARIRSLTGLKSSVINRIHYKIKEFMDKNAETEFVWRQAWDVYGVNDLRVFLNPLNRYSTKSCGPMHWICSQYNFQNKKSAPTIGPLNVRGQALKLLDQLRRKSLWFKHNIVLVLLGDDFYFVHPEEFDRQFENWNRLFDYFNTHSDELRVTAKFATLSEYFETADKALEMVSPLKTLGGDFFTYNDRDGSFWSGYFTTRMAWKVLGRRLESLLRAADVFFTFSADARDQTPASRERKLRDFQDLRRAHQDLALFQHHDDITGTSRKDNAADVARRLCEGFALAQKALVSAVWSLMESGSSQGVEVHEPLWVTLSANLAEVGVKPVVVDVRGYAPSVTLLVLVNSLPFKRREIIRLRINQRHVEVKTATNEVGKILRHQIEPVWSDSGDSELNLLELVIEAEMEPFEIKRLFVQSVIPASSFDANSATVVNLTLETGQFPFTKRLSQDRFSLSNGCLGAEFHSATGLLRRIVKAGTKQRNDLDARIGFWWYPSAKSGAYVFLPSGPAKESSNPIKSVIVEGPLVTTVRVVFPMIEHIVEIVGGRRLHGHISSLSLQTCAYSELLQSLRITNRVLLQGNSSNLEPVMRIDTDIDSGANFFSDANGLAMMRRERFAKLQIQGNFYPMPSAAFIEDRVGGEGKRRLTLLSAQPQGVSSQHDGSLEVMQDRRLLGDDGRGMRQGVLDNKLSMLQYDLTLEERWKEETKEPAIPLLSLAAHQLRRRLNSPLEVFFSAEPKVVKAAAAVAGAWAAPAAAEVEENAVPQSPAPAPSDSQSRAMTPKSARSAAPFPCDVDLISLRPLPNLRSDLDDKTMALPSKEAVFTLFRPSLDCRYPPLVDVSTFCSASGGAALSLERHLGEGVTVRNARATSLTLLHDGAELGDDPVLKLEPEALISIVAEVGSRHGRA